MLYKNLCISCSSPPTSMNESKPSLHFNCCASHFCPPSREQVTHDNRTYTRSSRGFIETASMDSNMCYTRRGLLVVGSAAAVSWMHVAIRNHGLQVDVKLPSFHSFTSTSKIQTRFARTILFLITAIFHYNLVSIILNDKKFRYINNIHK